MLFWHIHIYVPMKFHEKMLITEKVIKKIQKMRFLSHHLYSLWLNQICTVPLHNAKKSRVYFVLWFGLKIASRNLCRNRYDRLNFTVIIWISHNSYDKLSLEESTKSQTLEELTLFLDFLFSLSSLITNSRVWKESVHRANSHSFIRIQWNKVRLSIGEMLFNLAYGDWRGKKRDTQRGK